MDIRNLRFFMTVVDHGNISAAAESLNMAQPVLSRHIRNLEHELDTKVFDRKSRGVEPNANGRILIEATRSIEANYRSALRDLAEAQTATAGSLRVGATTSWLHRFVPATVASITTSHPSARITVRRGPPDNLVKELLKGQLDIVLAPRGAVANYAILLDTQIVYRAQYAILAAVDHPVHKAHALELGDLHQWQWVLPGSAYARDIFESAFTAADLVPPSPSIELEDTGAMFDIVGESALLSYGLSGTNLGDRIHPVSCPALNESTEHSCMTVRNSTPSPLGRLFIKTLSQQAGG